MLIVICLYCYLSLMDYLITGKFDAECLKCTLHWMDYIVIFRHNSGKSDAVTQKRNTHSLPDMYGRTVVFILY